ncbi:ABC transporter permease [Couchioplanes caeruleus]|uniref:ABC transporter permease n=1 Tax=Couchioplanes caeruleus TaxID=56438 RepID=UPI0031F8CA82
MPPGLRQFAEYQPYTPIMETVRGLLAGTPVGADLVASAAWCAGIALAGYVWAKWKYDKQR